MEMGEPANDHPGTPPPQEGTPPPPPPPPPQSPQPNLSLSQGPPSGFPPRICSRSTTALILTLLGTINFTAEALVLAFQHYIVMLGTTVLIASSLVPLMGGDHGDKAQVIQSLLFISGISTLLQTFLGTRLPTVMGASLAFYLPVLSIIHAYEHKTFHTEQDRFKYTTRTIQGSLMISSLINIILGFSQLWGKFTRLFTPVTIVPVVSVVGLGLFLRGFPLVRTFISN